MSRVWKEYDLHCGEANTMTTPKPDNLEEKAREWLVGDALYMMVDQIPSLAALLRSTVAEAVKEKEEEIHFLKTCGVVELAIRNPNVASYMAHWEGRTEAAEDALAQARRDGAREMREKAAVIATAERVFRPEFIRALPLPEGDE